MNRSFVFSIILLSSLCIHADESVSKRPNITQDMPNVQVYQDSAVGNLLNAKIYGKQKTKEIPGYRVQIYSSNLQQTAKAQALDLQEKLAEQLSEPMYVQYKPPFWKVRLGNFRTYAEANKFKTEFIAQYPDLQGDTYVVRDQIEVK